MPFREGVGSGFYPKIYIVSTLTCDSASLKCSFGSSARALPQSPEPMACIATIEDGHDSYFSYGRGSWVRQAIGQFIRAGFWGLCVSPPESGRPKSKVRSRASILVEVQRSVEISTCVTAAVASALTAEAPAGETAVTVGPTPASCSSAAAAFPYPKPRMHSLMTRTSSALPTRQKGISEMRRE